MGYNKIIINGEDILDLTQDTVKPEDVALGKTFHLRSGELAEGTLSLDFSGSPVEVSTDAEMEAALAVQNLGKMYKFVGISSIYETGVIYVIGEV